MQLHECFSLMCVVHPALNAVHMYSSMAHLGVRPSLRSSGITEFNECGCSMRETETNRRAGPEYAASVLCNHQKGDVHIYLPTQSGPERMWGGLRGT